MIKNPAKAKVTQIKTLFPASATASLNVSKNPVANNAPAAKDTKENEILRIKSSLVNSIDTKAKETIEAKKVKNKIFNNI